MSHRRDVEAALPKMHILSQQEIQRLHIQALLALDDTLRELVAEMKRTGPKTEPFLYVLDPSEDE
jgi:hypothetical protein